MAELKKKEKDLQETLAQKLEELKKICMREAVNIYPHYCFHAHLNRRDSQLTQQVSLFS